MPATSQTHAALSALAPRPLVEQLRQVARANERSASAELRLAVAAWLQQGARATQQEQPIDQRQTNVPIA